MSNLNAETPPGYAMAGQQTTLTRGQVATRLGISPERVRQLTIAGRLPCTETPLGRLYRDSDVRAFAHERESRTPVRNDRAKHAEAHSADRQATSSTSETQPLV